MAEIPEDMRNEDPYSEDIWNGEELSDEEVVIEENSGYNLNLDDEEEFSAFEEEEDEDIRNLRADPNVAAWLPEPNNSFSGIFKNEGARTGQPTNLNSSAIGRGQMIKGTRMAMYKKLGITDVEAAEQAFRTDPDFEMQVLNTYRSELDRRIPSNVQGKQREYMIAKGWYTGDPFYDDSKVPGKSAGNRLTAGEYARRATMQYGGDVGPEMYNIPEFEQLEGISPEAVQQYLEYEEIDPNNYQPASTPTMEDLGGDDESNNKNNKIANAANNVLQGVDKFKKFKDKLNNIGAGAARTVSEAIDFQSEIAGIQRNAVSLRKFNEQKNRKKYSVYNPNLNQPLIYT